VDVDSARRLYPWTVVYTARPMLAARAQWLCAQQAIAATAVLPLP